MKGIKSYFLTAVGVVVVVGSFMLSGAHTSSAAPPPATQDVRVVNTTTNPVPILAQGTTNVAGTVQAAQSGAWNVGISGTPTFQVGNTASNPVFVSDVNEPAMHPFQTRGGVPLNAGSVDAAFGIPVPGGKRLAIKFVSALASVPTGQVVRAILFTTIGGVETQHNLVMTPQGTFGLQDDFAASQAVEIFADGGTQIFVEFDRSGGGVGTGGGTASISGYLINMP